MATHRIPHQVLEARFAAEGGDREKRVVPMVAYTGATIIQFNWEHGRHNLTLSMEPGHVRMKRIKAGAPFTNGHADPSDPSAVIGRVTGAKLDGGNLLADVRFSKRPEVDVLLEDIFDGILENVSIEARIYKMKETTADKDTIKSFVATDWEPTAVALVAQGADPNAKIKASEEVRFSECQIEVEERASSPQENSMENDIDTGASAPNTAQLAAVQAESARAAEIINIAKLSKLDMDVAAKAVSDNASVDAFRKLALETLAARSEENPTVSHRATQVTRDQGDTLRAALPQAILAVQGLETVKPTDPGYEYRNLAARGLMAIASECLEAKGVSTRTLSKDRIVELALTTSDLPFLLGATADSALRAGFSKVPAQWPKLAARRVVGNFRPQYEITATVVAGFPLLNQSGEYKVATVTEGRESYRVYTYGNKLHVTRQTIINDSLGGLTDVPVQMGARAAYRQDSLFWTHLLANGVLSDNVALFAADHNNLITGPGTVISVDNLGIARKTLAVQTDEAGEIIGLTPAYMVVSAAKEQLARQYLSGAYNPSQSSTINPWAGIAELIVAPKLDATAPLAWYMFADPSVAPVLVQVYLAGNEGVFAQSGTTVDIDGFQWLMRFDFGVGTVDHRGAVRNDGA